MTWFGETGNALRGVGAGGLGWRTRIWCAFCVAACLLRPAESRGDFTENFDGATPPTLPSGWSATNVVGPAPPWVTTATESDSGANNAFVDAPAVNSDKRLDTPPIPIATNTAVLTFRSKYTFESKVDGGVLEISNNGGPFQDILDAGGSFAGGGYDDVLVVVPGFYGPITGRKAWTGTSPGYILTTVNLPVAAAGKNIVLRFRMGTNGEGPGTGWHIDSIEIQSQDRDSDIVADSVDNCPGTANTGQEDTDGDGKGNACDNCPNAANVDQADSDADGVGNVCDTAVGTGNETCGACGAGAPLMMTLAALMLMGARSRLRSAKQKHSLHLTRK
jgi:hypothetical protein